MTFGEKLSAALKEAVRIRGEMSLSSYDDRICDDMLHREGVIRLNAMSNVDFMQAIIDAADTVGE